ncbi:MAG: hypothetical protein ACK40G_09785 [Cytophagaceae bacterium]
MKYKLILLFNLILGSLAIAQDNPFTSGKIEDNTYINDYFKFKLNVPDGWAVQNKEQMDYILEKGKKVMRNKSEEIKDIINASEGNYNCLLSVFQYEQGYATEFNPSFVVMAENVSLAPGIKSGYDYLFHVIKILNQINLKHDKIDKEAKKKLLMVMIFIVLI